MVECYIMSKQVTVTTLAMQPARTVEPLGFILFDRQWNTLLACLVSS